MKSLSTWKLSVKDEPKSRHDHGRDEARPGTHSNLPIKFSTKIEMVFNLNTAKALGLSIPESFLARADEVIE